MARPSSLPPAAYGLTLAVCLGFGGLALWLGMDADWDLRNYHWYNGWAFAHGLVGRDLLVGMVPSFFNPTLDLPYALLAEHLPAKAVAVVLAAVEGLNVLPLFALAWSLLTVTNPNRRFLAAAGIALAGMLSAGALSEAGTAFLDTWLSLPVLIAALLVVRGWDDLADGTLGLAALRVLPAGMAAGLAFGLKQTCVIYCIGLCFAFLAADMAPFRRLWLAFWFGIGVLAGALVTGGHWWLHLWQAYGNPMFPFFNDLFRSPWGLPIPYRDDVYVPHGLVDKLTYILRVVAEPRLASETEFRDLRIPAIYLLVPLAALASLPRVLQGRRQPDPLTRPGPTGWLLATALIAMLTWVWMFAIHRYLIPLEMLAPLVAVAAIGLLPLPRPARHGLSAGLLAFLVASTLPGDWIRVPWTPRAVEVTVPPIEAPAGTLVLLSGHEPMSYLIPAFPPGMRFYRIDSTFTLPDDPSQGFRRLFREAIAAQTGPLASLHYPGEEHDVVRKLAEYGLALDKSGCRPVTSPLAPGPYAYCPVGRLP